MNALAEADLACRLEQDLQQLQQQASLLQKQYSRLQSQPDRAVQVTMLTELQSLLSLKLNLYKETTRDGVDHEVASKAAYGISSRTLPLVNTNVMTL